MPRCKLLSILCALALAAAGCGDDEAPQTGARVRIITSEIDGPVEGRLKLRAIEEAGDKTYDLEPVAGDPGLYAAPGAPPALYGVVSTAGWGMLWGGGGASTPRLRGPEHPATLVRMGRPRTLYLGPADPRLWQLSGSVGVEVKSAATGDEVPFERVAAQVRVHPEGMVSVQLDERHWRAGQAVRALGVMEGEVPTRVVGFVLGDTPYAHLPRLAMVDPAPQAMFRVHLVPPPGVEQVADGTPVRVELKGLPLDLHEDAATKGGTARFDNLAALGGGLRVRLPRSGPRAVFEIDAETRRLQGETWIIATPADAVPWAADDGIGSPVVEARVLYPGGRDFGRVLLDVGGVEADGRARVRLLTLPGPQEWILRHADGRWSHHAVEVPSDQPMLGVSWSHPVAKGAGCQVRGTVSGALPGSRVTFRLLVRPPRDAPVTFPEPRSEGGGGFVAAVSPQGAYEAVLAPGTWVIRVEAPSGRASEPRTLDLEPGTHLRLDLQAR